MSDIEFNIDKENEYLKQSFQSSQENKNFDLVKFLLEKNIAKDEKQANIFLVICVITMIALGVYIFFFSSSNRQANLTPAEYNFLNSSNGKQTPAQYDAALFAH